MIVKDIFEDARSITNYTDEALNFSRITDAVETLCNKADFDILLGYLTIAVTGNIVTLPPDVETPIRVNIDDNPTFTRGRVFEFSLNGPGSGTERTDWSWEDKGVVAVIKQPNAPALLTIESTGADNGKKIYIEGRDQNGLPISREFVLNAAENYTTFRTYRVIERVRKDVTQNPVTLRTAAGLILSEYAPGETEPNYRQIRLSSEGRTAYIMFRRKRFAINSQEDFIPIRSKMGLLYMLKAHQAYREERVDMAAAFEAQAIKLATEEQASRHNYGAPGQELATIRNYSTQNRDSVIVADIYDEMTQILGPVGEGKVYDAITEAVELLDNKANWDGKLGFVDIVTSEDDSIITLPRFVDTIVKMNINGQPSITRSKWYEFHLNGPGQDWLPVDSWKERGEGVLLHDVNYLQRFVVVPNLAVDLGIKVRGYGYNEDSQRIMTPDASGKRVDGFPIDVNMDGTITSTVKVVRIERIEKGESRGFVKLLGRNLTGGQQLVQGLWAPDETAPLYRKVEIPAPGAVVRIMYRKRTLKVSSMTDPLHLKSRLAITTAARALASMRLGKPEESTAYETKAMQYLTEKTTIDSWDDNKEGEFMMNFRIKSRDQVIVSDIYDEVGQITGSTGRLGIYDAITESIELLDSKDNWDGKLGFVDIALTSKVATLPRFVETVVKVNINGNPSIARSKWYEYHLNGPGEDWLSQDSWKDKNEGVLIEDVPYQEKFVAIPGLATDDGLVLRAYGYDVNGKRIMTADGPGGARKDGFPIAVALNGVVNPVIFASSIERIEKPASKGFITLLGRNQANTQEVVQGIWEPNETSPMYRKIELPVDGATVRIMYRKRTLKVSGMSDPLHLKSRLAITTAARSIAALRQGKPDEATAFEIKAMQYLTEKHTIDNQNENKDIEFLHNFRIQSRDEVIVSDIYDEIGQITGPTGKMGIYDAITEALEWLDSKENWDGKLGYVDIATTGKVVTLPRFVDSVVKLNINGNPTIRRSKWYEYHLDGPGEGWVSEDSWKERGEGVLLEDVSYQQKFVAIPGLAADDGLVLRAYGYDNNGKRLMTADGPGGAKKDGFPIAVALDGVVSPVVLASKIERIEKPVSKGFITLMGRSSNGSLEVVQGVWEPDETSPKYRKIELPVEGATVRIMYRKRTLKVSGMTDPIHLKSRVAITTAARAMAAIRAGKTEEATALETKALQYMIEVNMIDNRDDNKEKEFLMNFRIKSRDEVIVSDVYDEIAQIIGPAGKLGIYDAITESIELLDSKENWDGKLGYVDIATTGKIVTLPRFVETVVKLNINGNPSIQRSKWYEYHLDGPGEGWVPQDSWKDRSDGVLIEDVSWQQKFVAVPGLAADDGLVLRAYGYDKDGKRIMTGDGPGGARKDGFPIAVALDGVVNPVVFASRIERIEKPVSKGFITLLGRSPVNFEVVQGVWEPDETSPKYRKIELPIEGATVRIMYRKRNLKVSSMTDPLHLKSRLAITTAARSIAALRAGNPNEAVAFEAKAAQYLTEKHTIDNQDENKDIEFLRNFRIQSRDQVAVSDIYDEIGQIAGATGRLGIYDAITEAIELLDNKANWDGKLGFVDIAISSNLATLPRFVETIVKMNVNGQPSISRSKWYEYHLNGPGQSWIPCDSWLERGEGVLINADVGYLQKFVVVADANDLGVPVRGFGYDASGARIMTADGPSGELADGVPIPVSLLGNFANAPTIANVERIQKGKSTSWMTLKSRRSINGSEDNELVQGIWEPEELSPKYRRIELPQSGATVRIMYRKRTLKVGGLTDPLHLKSRLAITAAARSIAALRAGKVEEANAMESKALQYMTEKNLIDNQNETRDIEFQGDFGDAAEYVNC